MAWAYYNEIDPYAAQWIRNLIAAGHITAGEVDTRSILDVRPSDLAGFSRCHFFAGIGVWDYALSLAGWPADRPVWTGSCPCQPFSAAGKGGGFADERHLWPAWDHLIRECRPAEILGEQVDGSDGRVWLDLVQTDMEAAGYAFGPVVLPAAGVGAPNARHRHWFMAHTDIKRRDQGREGISSAWDDGVERDRGSGPLEYAQNLGREGREHLPTRKAEGDLHARAGAVGPLGDAGGQGLEGHELGRDRAYQRPSRQAGVAGRMDLPTGIRQQRLWLGAEHVELMPADAGSGYWDRVELIPCRDGKWRPIEPGTFPLAHGATARVGRLRAYGNAINAQAAKAFIQAVMEVRP